MGGSLAAQRGDRLEARREGYSIHRRRTDLLRNGGVLLPTAPTRPAHRCSRASVRPTRWTRAAPPSAPTSTSIANLTEKLLASAAVRAEHYSDFGSNLSGKISGRYDFNDAFALRGSVQNGFRAPSLQQQYFATTSTNFIGGVPFDITTFPATDPVARARRQAARRRKVSSTSRSAR